MSIKVCENGHLYDGRRFSACPHCGKTDDLSGNSGSQEPQRVQKIVISRRSVEDDGEKTVSYYSEFTGNNYVAGWLVCAEGNEKGRDYRVHFGFNRLGRSGRSDICISSDQGIAENNHCSVVYDDRSNKFFAVPGKGTVTYLNGVILEKASELNSGDRISVSDTELDFIPYCGGDKKWDQ